VINHCGVKGYYSEPNSFKKSAHHISYKPRSLNTDQCT